MANLANGLLLILFTLLFAGIASSMMIEHFDILPIATRSKCPTRNMDYDIRGEAYYPPIKDYLLMGTDLGPQDPSYCSPGLQLNA
jgi:hypothetical protein